MTALLVRLVILFAVLFGVAYGITRSVRGREEKRRIKAIEDELKALKAGRAQGRVSNDQYDHLLRQLQEKCERAGVRVPD